MFISASSVSLILAPLEYWVVSATAITVNPVSVVVAVISFMTVSRWRDKYLEFGVEGVGVISPGRGRKKSVSDETITAIVDDTLNSVPDDGSRCWSTRSLAAKHKVGKDVVQRVWKDRNLRPWKVDTFKVSTDPEFEEKLCDVIGLYLNPPEKAQCQALDRTQPSLPMRPGRNKTMTHDYKRNGKIDLFAAMNVATGEVIHETKKRHTGEDVLAFFKKIDKQTDPDLAIHVVLDNLSAHKSQPVKKWLNHPKQKNRWTLHFTPTSGSWVNMIEGWFSILTRKALTNTSFTSVKELTQKICAWTGNWNKNPNPFIWTKPAETIIQKTRRGKTTLTNVTKSKTHH